MLTLKTGSCNIIRHRDGHIQSDATFLLLHRGDMGIDIDTGIA